MWQHLKKLDWLLILCVVLLAGIGLVSIYSSSRGELFNFKKQIIFFAIGFVLMLALSFFDWKGLRDNSYLILTLYGLCCLALVGLFFLAPEIRGVKSWYKLGPFSFDPIEFTKIVLIILLAKYFSKRHIEIYGMRHILISGAYLLAPALLIFFQPNLGSALILGLIWLFILIVSGIKIRHFLVLLFCGILIFIASWSFLLKDYQKQRLVSFVIPRLSDPLGIGWSQRQAEIAIGSGGFWGKGFKQGSQVQHGFLSEAQTDFVFAALIEEFGLMSGLAVLFLFAVLLWRIMRQALLARANFARLFASGLAALLVSQIFINVGMNIGLVPIIGIPLPLVSYGGSGLIAICVGLGILLSIQSAA